MTLKKLLKEVRACTVCEKHIEPRPVVIASASARIIIVGQAPGTRVHATGISWNDPSGVRLRSWMDIDDSVFYDESKIAIIPMGFCYPGKGKSGDLPPRPECAPLWHKKLLDELPNVELVILAGQYAQAYYLGARKKKTLTETVEHFDDYGKFFPLPHPSPRNLHWLKKNKWFEKFVVPELKKRVRKLLK